MGFWQFSSITSYTETQDFVLLILSIVPLECEVLPAPLHQCEFFLMRIWPPNRVKEKRRRKKRKEEEKEKKRDRERDRERDAGGPRSVPFRCHLTSLLTPRLTTTLHYTSEQLSHGYLQDYASTAKHALLHYDYVVVLVVCVFFFFFFFFFFFLLRRLLVLF